MKRLALIAGVICFMTSFAWAEESRYYSNNNKRNSSQCINECPSQSCSYQTNCHTDECCPSSSSCYLVEAGYFYWLPRANLLPFSGNICSSSSADSYNLNLVRTGYNRGNGFRVGLGINTYCDWNIIGRYAHFSSSRSKCLGGSGTNSDTVYANIIDRSLASSAGLNGNFESGLVDAAAEKTNLRYNIGDIEVRKSVCICQLPMDFFYGIRYAAIDQKRCTTYTNTAEVQGLVSTDKYNISMNTDMRGVGIRAGAELTVSMWRNCVSLFGNSAFSALVSRLSVNRTDTTFKSVPETEFRSYKQKYHQLIPALESSLGAQLDWCGWSLRVGYEFHVWFNLSQNIDLLSSSFNVSSSQARYTCGNVTFDGFFLNLKKTF